MTMRPFAVCFALAVLLSVLLVVPGFAQSVTATLSGHVTDQSGAVVAGASIEATNIETNRVTVAQTNQHGLYVLPHLLPGRYRLFVRKDGFQAITKSGITLHVQDMQAQNFVLEVGSVMQSVTVRGDLPMVNSTSPAVSTVVDRQFVENLPLNGRSFQQLITLTPGVVLTKTNFAEPGQFSINGQRANANYFSVDGVSANAGINPVFGINQSAGGGLPALTASGTTQSLVSVDAMQEFRVQTSTFAPEFGRTPGGQISIVTRPGTNDFHGTVFEYFRNDKLDANDWFVNRQGLPKAALRQNDFGGVLGGPIVPNKTFFFFSYEGLRLRLPQTTIVTVPTVATRQGSPTQLQPFLNAIPLPTGADLGNGFAEFASTYSDPSDVDATSIRVDHTFNNNVNLFGRYSHTTSKADVRSKNTPSNVNNVRAKTQTLTLGSAQTIAPSVLNDFRVNYTRSRGGEVRVLDDFAGAVVPNDSDLFPSFASSEDALLTFQIVGPTLQSYFVGKNVANLQRQINLVDSLSVSTGKHQLKFGVDYRRLAPTNGRRSYSLTVVFLSLSEVLSGVPLLVSVGALEPMDLLVHNFSLYGQDTWKLTPRLTVTYGLRWEVNPAPRGTNGRDLFTVQGLDNPPTSSLAPPGTDLYETTYDNFAPRVGVAYQLSQKPGKETVLRGGFGLFYDLGSGSTVANFSFPYSRNNRFFFTPFPLDPALAEPPPFTTTPSDAIIHATDPDLKLPRSYQWNATVEQSLGSDQTLSVSYVGAIDRRLLRREELRNVNPSFQVIRSTRNAATSDYHALQLQFRRRLSRGLQVLASYTWSHSIDIASSDTQGARGIPVEFLDPSNDRGSSDFDIRHTFSSAVSYDIPSPARGGIGRALLGDWSIDTIINAHSATPVNLVARTDSSQGFSSVVRPDLVPGESLTVDDPTSPGGRRFNPAAFVAPPSGQQGTLGRNVLRGFDLWQMDFALRRQFHLTETLNLQFKAEFFNLFNHSNFADPVNDIRNSFFGQSIQMLGRSLGAGGTESGLNPLYQVGGPRSMQFALKLLF